ncbi:hypothetical protein [Pontibacter amylolyticus]|uniref:hypothetical protein n=1 Tax=Pontibacter amylolyticus TaxID=1424080 RepID=UPI0016652345|nr:hypothetical protein [Pontibacter amylolyticus]
MIIPTTITNALLPPKEPICNNPPFPIVIKNAVFVCLIALFFIAFGILIGNAVPIIISGFIFILLYHNIKKVKSEKKIYEKAYAVYKLYLNDAFQPRSTVSYTRNGKHELFDANLYIVNKIDESLKQAVVPRITTKKSKRGHSELYFKRKLLKYLNLEFVDNEYEVRFSDVTYYPDIVISSKVGINTLYIDVEIDEPYSFSLHSRPIHHIETDDLRNRYFENGNWIIVRFSEEQVYKFTDECCELILSIIKHINSGGLERIFDYDGIKVPHWSYNQGLKMQADNYRSSYLPKAYKI